MVTKATLSLFLSFVLSFAANIAEANWDVVIFFAGAEMSADYQRDIDQNIMELARIDSSSGLRLLIIRALPKKLVIYEPKSAGSTTVNQLLANPLPSEIIIPGRLTETSIAQISDITVALKSSGDQFFKSKYRAAILYGHGRGTKGFSNFNFQQTENLIATLTSNHRLNLLWLDSCFMGSIEVAWQFAKYSDYYIGSQDSAFSAGLYYSDLGAIEYLNPKDAATTLATHFIESYSTIRSGRQSHVVESSAAVISVIDSEKLKILTPQIRNDWQLLRSQLNEKSRLWKNRTQRYKMDDDSLTDFGHLISWLDSSELNKAMGLLDRSSLQSTPRLKIKNPGSAKYIVYGYNGWKSGHATDHEVIQQLPHNMNPQSYFKFSNSKSFPMREIGKSVILSPFIKNTFQFDWMFLDKNFKPTGKNESAQILTDIYTRFERTNSDPVVFLGKTLVRGSESDKYSGLNVSNPMTSSLNLKYKDLDFVRDTQWGN
jgi:hypothetical protein